MESQELQQDAPQRDANPLQIGQKPIYCPPELILIFKFYLYSGAVRVQYRTCIALSRLDLCFLGLQLFRGDSLYRNYFISMRYPYYLFLQRIRAIALQ